MPIAPTDPSLTMQAEPFAAMPRYRIEAYVRAVAARLREGGDNQAVLATMVREQQALAVALADPAFAHALTRDFIAELKLQEPNNAYQPDEQQAAAQMQGILRNRIRDAHGFEKLLSDASFIDHAQKLALEPATPPKSYELPPEKKEEMVRRFVSAQDPEGAEPLVHVAASAMGHQIVHQALANIFRPQAGHLREPLQEALHKAWPEASPEQLTLTATSWLKARHDPAHYIADALKPGGELYNAATKRCEEARNSAARPLTPRDHEKSKASLERAEDVAYTLNHALSCLTTDVFVAPLISAGASALFGKNIQVGCKHPGHEHGTHAAHDHHDHAFEPQVTSEKLSWSTFRHEAGEYFRGEVIGDFAAVPLTVAVQRFAPGVMETIRHVVEPIASPAFRHGAQNAAERWATKHGLAKDDQQVIDRAEMIYNHEIKHLPQAVMWNVFSFPAGVIGQKWGSKTNIWEIIAFKSLGALISNGTLLTWRATMPDQAEKFDRVDSKYVVRPTTRVLGKLFGVKDADVDRLEEKEKSMDAAPKWSQRLTATREQQATVNPPQTVALS